MLSSEYSNLRDLEKWDEKKKSAVCRNENGIRLKTRGILVGDITYPTKGKKKTQ